MASQKYLGIDYGDKNIGLSLGTLGSIAVPYKILSNISQNNVIEELQRIIIAENIDGVVIGVPTSLSGNMNERADITLKFIQAAKEKITVPVFTVDESFTSQLYTKQGVTKDIDKYSATAILETFLAQNESKL